MALLTLATLPSDVILAICATMCNHCSGASIWPDGSSGRRRKSSLRNLSLTCRLLRDIAQPILYHNVHPKDLLPLLRTAIERPHLAANVRGLSNHQSYQSEPSPKDIQLLEAAAQCLGICKKPGWLEQILTDELSRDNWILELTLAHLPNVEALSLTLPYISGELDLGNLLQRKVLLASIRRLYITHSDQEDGMIDLTELGPLLSAMPNLKSLDVHLAGGMTEPLPFPELRSLSFAQANIGIESLERIVSSCPKLQMFEYDGSMRRREINEDSPEFTWGQAQRILLQRKDTIRHLNFDFGDDFLSLREEGLETDDYCGSFKEFTALETLFVWSSSLVDMDADDEASDFPESVQDVIDVLPESLKLLAFARPKKGWNGIQILVQAIKRGHFPSLKTVLVGQDGDELKESRDALASVGLSCEKYDYARHSLGNYASDGWNMMEENEEWARDKDAFVPYRPY